MLSKFNLFELFKDGFSEIKIGKNYLTVILIHLFLPILLAILFLFFNVIFDNDIVSTIISSISIFSGLLFSVIFNLLQNYSNRRKLMTEKPDEETQNYLARYKEFTENVTTLILFSIAIALITIVVLIVFLLAMKANMTSIQSLISIEEIDIADKAFMNTKKVFLNFLQSFSIIFLFNYILIILALIKEVYAMIFDGINAKT